MSIAWPRILARRQAERGFARTEQIDLEFSNGARRTYHRILNQGSGAVVIVAVDAEACAILIREYSAGVQRYELGLPKGRLEAGERPVDGANRELKEEAGLGAHTLVALGRLALAPSYMSQVTDVVLARDLYPERLPGDEPELMAVTRWPLADLHTLIAREDVTAARSVAALFMAREYLAGRYQPPGANV